MVHEMRLFNRPFQLMKSGKKKIEVRIADEKREKVSAGDEIVFTNTVTGEKLRTLVKDIIRKPTFIELYSAAPLSEFGADCSSTAEDMAIAARLFYEPEKEQALDAIGIVIELIKD